MRLLIGIPVFNGSKYISNCLQSILETCQDLDYKVVVVDDASKDDTATVVKGFSEVTLIHHQTNRGVAISNNELLAEATGFDYFLRLDVDTVLKPDAVLSLVKFLNDHSNVGLVSAGIQTPDGKPSTSYFTYYQTPLTWFWEYNFLLTKFFRIIKSLVIRESPLQGFMVKALATTAVMVRMSAVAKVGEFDENLPFFLEDSDWAKRFWDAGFEVWVAPSSKVVHYGGSSDEEIYIMCRDRSLASLYRFTAKHWPGRINQWFLTASVIGGTVLNLIVTTFLLPLSINGRIRKILAKNYRSFGNVLKWLLLNHRKDVVTG